MKNALAEPRVIVGPYRKGIDLKELFARAAGQEATTSKPAVELHRVTVAGVPSSVYLTQDWAERQNDWESAYRGILSSENELKEEETDIPLRYTVFQVRGKQVCIAGPDSEEREETALEIAKAKLIMGLLEPMSDATPKEVAAAMEALGVESTKHALALAEDRELIGPEILKEASVWDDVRDQDLVEECFEDGAEFPGKRINELQNACGGAVSFLLRWQAAKAEMREKGFDVSDEHISRVTYYLRFVEYDESQPLPKEGIFISASEHGRRFLPVTDRHIEIERAKGVQYELNDFDVPTQYHGMFTARGAPVTMETLRADPNNDYFRTQFCGARAMRAFAALMNIPRRNTPREHIMEDVPDAELASNLSFGEFAASASKLGVTKAGYWRMPEAHRIRSHEDLEVPLTWADGTVIEEWPEQAPEGVRQDLYELERKLIARLLFANRATLKPLGEHSAYGRPILVQDDVREAEFASYHNAVKLKTVGGIADRLFKRFSGDTSLVDLMQAGQWDTAEMKPLPRLEGYKLPGRQNYLEKVGGKTLGFTEAFLGSASSHLKSGNDDAEFYAYETAKMGVAMTHGGGGRKIMGKFWEGAIRAWKEGYRDFLSIGSRVPVASRKEGSQKPMLREHGFEIEDGDFDNGHLAFGQGCFHSFSYDHMGERQHSIIGPAHLVTSFVGGIGTDYEFQAAMYHNLMVEMRGYGIFPGFGTNTDKKRIHFVNSTVKNGNDHEYGYYDELKNSLTPEQWEILDVHFYDTPEEALEARDDYAEALGYDLDALFEDPMVDPSDTPVAAAFAERPWNTPMSQQEEDDAWAAYREMRAEEDRLRALDYRMEDEDFSRGLGGPNDF